MTYLGQGYYCIFWLNTFWPVEGLKSAATTGYLIIFISMFVSGLAHGNGGRIAGANFFGRRNVSGEILSSLHE